MSRDADTSSREQASMSPHETEGPSASEKAVHRAIDRVRALIEKRTTAVQKSIQSLDKAVRRLEGLESKLSASRSPLGLPLKGQAIYDALPADGAVVGLDYLSEATGFSLQAVAVSASGLSRYHSHLVRRMGLSAYCRQLADSSAIPGASDA